MSGSSGGTITAATNVPSPAFGPNGFVAPTETSILAGRQEDINAAFGGSLDFGLSTPQGQLASSDTAIIGDCYDQFCLLANSVDPAYASGRMQDAIGRFYFLDRIQAVATSVVGTASGAPGVIIPAGFLVAQDAAGNLYAPSVAATLTSAGSATLTVINTITGPISIEANALLTYQTIPGLDSITNSTQGALGQNVETRQAFEYRRANSVSGNSLNTVQSIRAALLNTTGITDCYVTDNSSGSTLVVGGVTLNANSLYVCPAGSATSSTIGQVILSKKSPGCNYTGNTTVTAYDNNSMLSVPIPYTVIYETPTAVPIYFAISIKSSASVPSNAATLIQSAIVNAWDGQDDGPPALIGSTLYALRYASDVSSLGTWAQLVSMAIGTSASPTGSSVTMNINQQPTIAPSNIAVTLV